MPVHLFEVYFYILFNVSTEFLTEIADYDFFLADHFQRTETSRLPCVHQQIDADTRQCGRHLPASQNFDALVD